MNTVQAARARPSNAQETIQTALLLVVSIVGAWLVYSVPWQLSADPCLAAAAASEVTFICLWLTRWQGPRGVAFERYLLGIFLAAMPVIYVMRYFFATGEVAKQWFWIEILGVLIFGALAMLGVKRSPWFLAAGIPLHGLAWDSWHYHNSTYMPDWYAIACLIVDVALGAYVAARVPVYQRGSGH